MKIFFDQDIRSAAPGLRVVVVEADVCNAPTSDPLWQEIQDEQARVAAKFPIEAIRHRPAIDATRRVYKTLGKEPNRYRPSAEALARRSVKGLELYRTLTVIDLINLVSLHTGHSIGGFDADSISGDTLTLGVGREGEPYEAIGRGQLNICGLPVWRDAQGGIGTPTSDNERTKLTDTTCRLLMTVNVYGEAEEPIDETVEMITRLLRQYAGSQHVAVEIHTVGWSSM